MVESLTPRTSGEIACSLCGTQSQLLVKNGAPLGLCIACHLKERNGAGGVATPQPQLGHHFVSGGQLHMGEWDSKQKADGSAAGASPPVRSAPSSSPCSAAGASVTQNPASLENSDPLQTSNGDPWHGKKLGAPSVAPGSWPKPAPPWPKALPSASPQLQSLPGKPTAL